MPRAKTPSTKEPRDAAAPASEPVAIDGVLRDLERVVQELEAGELPLEAALTRFEEGVRLARQGGKMLDDLEQRVEVLLADRDEAVPFHRPGDDDDDDAL